MKTKRGKKGRNRNLKILNAVLKGDYGLAKELHGKGKNTLRLLFVMDRDFSDRYILLSDLPEFSPLQKEMIYTKDEALQMAENYSGCLFIDRASKSMENIPKQEFRKMAEGVNDERIIINPTGFTRISNGSDPKPGERIKIKVNIKE